MSEISSSESTCLPAAKEASRQSGKKSLRALRQNPLSQITEGVYLTGVSGVTRPDLMGAAGITHVLNVAGQECSHLTYDMNLDSDSKAWEKLAKPDSESHTGASSREHNCLDLEPAVESDNSSRNSKESEDLRSKLVDRRSRPPTLTVRFVPLRDSADQSLLPYLDDLVDYVSEAVSSGGRVVVHCLAGVSRSASVVIAYLVREHGMTLRDAHDYVIARRDVIRPNPGFWAALVEYEFKIRGENSVDILDYAAGSVPSLETYQKEVLLRMRLGWMDHVFYNLGAQIFILIAQMVASLFIFSDYSTN
ncbi:dual specificity protein phosphatase 18 [Plakobranchus ocellatus]|uniref:protein-tyrosine-phosphatase n=1 Tax=Plakobranchus ocellatus TaxID=259542 RepID=A0AAV4A9S7_9GAST|nr:dual specificity protein phosphatase 18 [Plakobranchus ocellatus]